MAMAPSLTWSGKGKHMRTAHRWNSDPLDSLGRGRGFNLAGSPPIKNMKVPEPPPQPMPSRKPHSAGSEDDISQLGPEEFIAKLQKEFDFVTEENQQEFQNAVLMAFKHGESQAKSLPAQPEKSEDINSELKDIEKKAATTGEFDVRDRVGQKWQRYLKMNKIEAESYKLMTMPEKRERRANWAKETLSHIEASKEHVATWREVDTKFGEYQTFGTLVQGYGGWKWKPTPSATAAPSCDKASTTSSANKASTTSSDTKHKKTRTTTLDKPAPSTGSASSATPGTLYDKISS